MYKKILFVLLLVYLLLPLLLRNIKLEAEDSEDTNPLTIKFFSTNKSLQSNDCCIITYGNFEILIDSTTYITGSENNNLDNIVSEMRTILEKEGSDGIWDMIICTHSDGDHLNGFPYIFNSIFCEYDTIENTPIEIKSRRKLDNNKEPSIGCIIDFDVTELGKENNNSLIRLTKNSVNTRPIDYYTSETENVFVQGTSYDEESNSTEVQYKANYERYCGCRDLLVKNNICGAYYPAYTICARDDDTNAGSYKIGDLELYFLYNYFYDHRYSKDANGFQSFDFNNLSVCLLLQYGQSQCLFTGDLEEYDSSYSDYYGGETKLYENNKQLFHQNDSQVVLFKAGHHGSRTSNSRSFLNNIKPLNIIIPAVAGDYHGFPTVESVDNMLSVDANIYIPNRIEYVNKVKTAVNYYGNITVECYKSGIASVITQYDGNTQISNQETIPFVQTNWYQENCSVKVYTFDNIPFGSTSAGNNQGNCTLIKYGLIDIVIDCGSYNNSSYIMADKITKIMRDYSTSDTTIDYLILTNPNEISINNVIYKKGSNALLNRNAVVGSTQTKSYTVDTLVDWGKESLLLNTAQSKSTNVALSAYLSFRDTFFKNNNKKYYEAGKETQCLQIYYTVPKIEKIVDGETTKESLVRKKIITDKIRITLLPRGLSKPTLIDSYSYPVYVEIGETKAKKLMFLGNLYDTLLVNYFTKCYEVNSNYFKDLDYILMSKNGYIDPSSNMTIVYRKIFKDNTIIIANTIPNFIYGKKNSKTGFLNNLVMQQLKDYSIYVTGANNSDYANGDMVYQISPTNTYNSYLYRYDEKGLKAYKYRK